MNILLVHENYAILQNIKELIEICYPNDNIIAVTSASEALYRIHTVDESYGICFTKVVMRGASGFGIAEELRLLNQRAKVVLIASDEKFALEGWQFGMNDYLIEPLTLESIRHTLISCAWDDE